MEEIIKELGLKIDQFKTESCTKAELIELMSKVQALETSGEDVKTLKDQTEQLALKVLELETKGVKSDAPETLKSLLTAKKDELAAMKDKSGASVQITLKAAGTMAESTNITGIIPQGERETGITRTVRRNPYILQLVNIGTIMSNLGNG